jgi:hypothetical protein
MFDYSIYEKPVEKNENVRFRILLVDRKINITLRKEDSLEDLYIKVYNTIYPDFSQEKPRDFIPLSNASSTSYINIPKIYHMAVCNKSEHSLEVPFHRFITISAFMKTKPDYFENIAIIGTPMYRIFVIDEACVTKMQNPVLEKPVSILKKMTQCVY